MLNRRRVLQACLLLLKREAFDYQKQLQRSFTLMLNRGSFLGILITVCSLAAVAHADQPHMQAAKTHLQQARAQLQAASRNKGGHRAKALEYVNAAIAEVHAGIRFDRRHNHTQPIIGEVSTLETSPDQPHMQAALDHLRQGKSELEAATSDKRGHRVRAIDYVNKAIDETKKGIDAGE
jgi:exopolyphosphatase/pppGpp-phosphohydrolase